MKEINDEINSTINLMRTVNSTRVADELQEHLGELLEIKRDMIRRRTSEFKIEPTKSTTEYARLFRNQNLD